MDKNKIKKLSDFFYNSNSTKYVPLRLSISLGEFAGFDLNKHSFSELLDILSNSRRLKRDLELFISKYYNG